MVKETISYKVVCALVSNHHNKYISSGNGEIGSGEKMKSVLSVSVNFKEELYRNKVDVFELYISSRRTNRIGNEYNLLLV